MYRLYTYSGALVRGMSAGTFNGSFVGLGSRVAEEGLVGVAVLTQPVRQGSLLRNVIKVTNMMDCVHLISDRI